MTSDTVARRKQKPLMQRDMRWMGLFRELKETEILRNHVKNLKQQSVKEVGVTNFTHDDDFSSSKKLWEDVNFFTRKRVTE